jgi:spermidine synthase
MLAIDRRACLKLGLCMLVALSLLACATQTVVHERASRFGRIIVTQDHNGLRTLLFAPDGARQSVVKPGDPEHLELPYARYAFAGLALCEGPRRILVVGLGGGTLPGFLRRHYPDAAIDVVEIDADVVEVAKMYFGFREDSLMWVHVGDGREFIESVRQPAYDVMFLDAFGSHSVPPHLTTQEFLQAVRRALVPGGVAVGNVWKRSQNPLYDDMVRTYQEVFDELVVLNVAGAVNMILLALPRAQPIGRRELAQRARQIAAAKRFRFDLGELVDSGWVDTPEKKGSARVLRDADNAPPKMPED